MIVLKDKLSGKRKVMLRAKSNCEEHREVLRSFMSNPFSKFPVDEVKKVFGRTADDLLEVYCCGGGRVLVDYEKRKIRIEGSSPRKGSW